MTSGKRGTKLKTYDQAAMILEEVDADDSAYAAMGDDDPNEDDLIDVLVADGDEDACLVAEFETAAQDLLQEDPELPGRFPHSPANCWGHHPNREHHLSTSLSF